MLKFTQIAHYMALPVAAIGFSLPASAQGTARAKACGVETYNLGSSLVCGVTAYKNSSGVQCGVASYKTGTGEVCGTDTRESWTDWGESCSGWLQKLLANDSILIVSGIATGIGGLFSGNSEVRIHRVGFSVKTQTRYRCNIRVPKTCSHPDFGVESYNSCRHADFGVESYNTCQNESFGVDKYRACALKTADELKEKKNINKTLIDFIGAQQVNIASAFYVLENQENSMACLIARYENNARGVAASLLAELKNTYAKSFGNDYDQINTTDKCPENNIFSIVNATKNGSTLRDHLLDSYQSSEQQLTSTLTEILALKQDIVAQQDVTVATQLTDLESKIRSHLASVN